MTIERFRLSDSPLTADLRPCFGVTIDRVALWLYWGDRAFGLRWFNVHSESR